MAKTYTSRGFTTYAEFTDNYNATITVRESSMDPLDRVWVFVKGGTLSSNDGSAHLRVKHAIQLVRALKAFIDDQHKKGRAR